MRTRHRFGINRAGILPWAIQWKYLKGMGMRIHHIGKVVENIDEQIGYYRDMFGLQLVSGPVVDPIQKVEVAFVSSGEHNDLTVELIRPVGPQSPVSKFLKQGGGLHHMAFAVTEIQAAIDELVGKGALMIGNIVPGKGHGDAPTAWLLTPKKELIELVEHA
jgi:methylmalonyl-CoA/ethylmalonyl-CoA epimerase